MADNGFITTAEADAAASEPLGLDPGIRRYTTRREPYFFDFVEEQLIEEYGVGAYRRGGLKIHTTIDPELQDAGRAAIRSALPYSTDPSSAIVAIDPATGYIKAMASSGTYQDRKFNLAAQGHRQPGSAFKTFVLVTALRQGVDPNSTTYTSKPLDLVVPEYGPWKVSTYDDTYGGNMSITQATLRSDNTVYAQLDIDLGPKNVRETAEMMGITTQLDALPAEGLGGLRLGVSPLEMADAYATLASYGIHNEPIAITDGRVPRREDRRPRRAEAQARPARVGRVRGDEDPEPERAVGHRHGRETSAATPPARRARPTTSPTHGSSASPRTSRPRSGSATPTRASR